MEQKGCLRLAFFFFFFYWRTSSYCISSELKSAKVLSWSCYKHGYVAISYMLLSHICDIWVTHEVEKKQFNRCLLRSDLSSKTRRSCLLDTDCFLNTLKCNILEKNLSNFWLTFCRTTRKCTACSKRFYWSKSLILQNVSSFNCELCFSFSHVFCKYYS